MITARRGLWVSTLLILIIAAWAVRQWPDRGLWYDETVNAYFSERSWSEIWEWCTEIDNQMPLDFVLRKLWGTAAGTSEFSLRAFSVGCALLSVAGVIALGRRIGDSVIVGWLSALAFTLSQGFLYAAFEVRPYALALALFAWSSVVFWDLWEIVLTAENAKNAERKHVERSKDRIRYWRLLIAYVLLALLLLYTHYTALVALAAHGLYAVWQWQTHPAARRRIMIVLAHLATGFMLGYAPWILALAGRDIRTGTAYAGAITPVDALHTYTDFYVFGQRIVPPDVPPYLWGVIGVIVFALITWIQVKAREKKHDGLIFALLTICVPLAGLLIMVYGVQAKLSGRHGWPTWIGVSLIIGAGLGARNRWEGSIRWLRAPIWIAALLVIWLPARADLQPVYNSYLREAFAYINNHAEPGDVMILRDGTLFTAASYYDATLPWIGFPPKQLTDVDHPLFFDTAINDIEMLFETHNPRQVWILAWHGHIMDPQNLAEGMLNAIGERQPLENSFGFGDVEVARYVLHESPGELRTRVEALEPVVQTPGGGPIFLGGYVLNTEPVPRGGTVQIQTWWQRGEFVIREMRVSVRFYDSAGEFYAQVDQPPVAASFGQEHWQFNVPVLGWFALPVPPEMPSGPVEVKMLMYHMRGTFEPITVGVDEFVVID